MDKQEFLLLIPAIIYGVAIVDLLKVFSHRKNYFEVVGWGVFVLMLVVFSWMELYQKLELITGDNLSFFLIIIQSILFSQSAALITPEADVVDTKQYFLDIRKKFFYVMTANAILGLVMQLFVFHDDKPSWIRPLALIFYLTCAFTSKVWLRSTILISVLGILCLLIFTERLM